MPCVTPQLAFLFLCTTHNPMKARLALLCLCALNCFLLGQTPKPPTAAELSKTFQETKAKAEKGNALAQYNLGMMYGNGRGVAKDEVEAVKWYRKAADQGHADAQNNLGLMYYHSRGVAKDDVEAYKWYLLAGAQDDDLARREIFLIERTLTPQQRAEGQRLAREWKQQIP